MHTSRFPAGVRSVMRFGRISLRPNQPRTASAGGREADAWEARRGVRRQWQWLKRPGDAAILADPPEMDGKEDGRDQR